MITLIFGKFGKIKTQVYFKIAFSSVGAIVSALSETGSLEKGCFGLNVFVHLSSWIYVGMKKN